MCGLFGAIGWSGLDEGGILRALEGRGPDDRGRWRDDSHPEAPLFLHTRLAIQDLSPLGHQPMVSRAQDLVLVFNGEIYNQHLLRRELEGAGVRFHSTCDTEVLLEGFRHWGQALWGRLNGIFAVAAWEPGPQRLTLARDRFGVKPLLWIRRGHRCAFASELSALIASGCVTTDDLDAQALDSYRLWGAVAGPRTLLPDIRVLPAGHRAIRSRDGSWNLESFAPVPPGPSGTGAAADWTLDQATAAVAETLHQAVHRQRIGDRPVGLFLSGGLDSGLLAALLQQDCSQAVHSVSIGFRGLAGTADESDLAECTAAHLGLRHHTLRMTAEDLDAAFDDFIEAIDQPSIDGFNSHLVTGAARQQGMRVAFSGLGADELFGGYAHMLDRTPAAAVRARHIRLHLLSRQRRRQLDAERLERAGAGSGAAAGRAGLADCSRLELNGYLQDTLLRDTDAVTMAQGLELRVPYLDQDLVELALSIPEVLHRAEGPKTLLRRLAGDRLPAAILQAPKRGFNLALAPWLLSRHRFAPRRIETLLDRQLRPRGIRVPRRSLYASWLLLRSTGRWAPYWRWVVLGEWLRRTNGSPRAT